MIKMSNGKEINFYSFATKYCSHHKPHNYPLYDNYVEKLLVGLKKKDNFYHFNGKDMKVYAKYKEILIQFRIFYGLEKYNLKKIDKYLSQVGKKYFQKKY
jgi:hypothetical protein